MINLLDKFNLWRASKFFFFSKFLLTFWASSGEPKIPQRRVKVTIRADLKEHFFLFTRLYSIQIIFYFKISVSVKILPLYETLSLKFWKLVIFQWGSDIFWNISILLWNILFLNCAWLHRFKSLEPLSIWGPLKAPDHARK